MKNIKILSTTFMFLFILISCNKEEAPRTAELTNISPLSGSKNSLVTISGSNFGNNTEKVRVFFNDVEAVVQSVSDNEIKTEVPRLAMTGLIKVIVDGEELTGPEFTYEFSEAHVTTLAGNKDEGGYADGQGTAAKFGAMNGIALDKNGTVFIAEHSNNDIRKITPNGLVSTFLKSENGFQDGNLTEAKISWPQDIAIDAAGNTYIIDTSNNKIRKITPEGMVSTLAGTFQGYADGIGTEAKFYLPKSIAVDNTGTVYIGDSGTNHSRIRKITSNGIVTTIAGGENGFADGEGINSKFNNIQDLAIDSSGNLIVCDANNDKIRKISPTGKVTTIAGSDEGFLDGNGNEAKFNFPYGVTVDKLDNIYVADYSNMRIRKISPEGNVSTIAGKGTYGFDDGEGINATIAFPRAITVDDDFNLYFTQNYLVRKITQE